MVNETVLKQILASNPKEMENYQVVPRELPPDDFGRRVFFYNDKVEVDFYVPEVKPAVLVSCSITQAESTIDRELEYLQKLPKVLPCEHCVIFTYDDSDSITDEFGTIGVVPLWKWIFSSGKNTIEN